MKLKPIKTYAYSGLWRTGELGWNVSPYLYESRTDAASRRYVRRPYGMNVAGEKLYLCRVTLTPIKDKRGRYIVRKAKP